MATSPSDKDNINVVDWLDRLQAGNTQPEAVNTLKELRSAAFALDSRGDKMDVGDSDDGGEDDGGEGDIEEEEPEDIPSALPDAAVPIGLLANLSLVQEKANEKGKAKAKAKGKQPATGAAVDDDDNIGVANKEYFLPGPASDLKFRKNLIEQHSPPEIILHGLVDSGDVSQLFDIFWKQVNPFIGLLDPNVHTAESIFARCPFLFTVICAISSRYYSAKSEIYPIAMHFAKHSAANALIDGWKSVELCQAYILMSIYAVPARRWEEDRSWLYTGLAIRIATDLNLHHAPTAQPQNEKQEREILNRARVWMICFNIDRSTATQFGKPSTIKEDYLTRNSADWYKQSQFRDKYDIHLCAYSSLLRIVGRFHDEIFSDPSSPTGLNRQINFLQVTLMHDEHLTHYFEEWTRRFKEESDHNDAGCAFRCTLLPFLVNYSRLVMYSFGFQHAFQRGIEVSDNVFFTKCFDAAKIVIKHMIEVLAPSGFMRSAPDGHFVFASFASAFMLKLLRPEFVQLLTRKMEDEIFELIGRLITTLQEVAIDERHTPRLYARFLAGLLTKHRKGGGGVAGRLQQMPPPNQTIPHTQPGGNQSQHLSFSGPSHSTSQPHDTSVHQGSGDPMQYVATASHDVISTTTTIYRPDTAYTDGRQMDISGPVDVGMLDDFGSLSDTNTLATMHALNEVWWENMMMPGFSWPEAPMMNSNTCNQNLPGFSPGFGGFPPAELNTAAAAI
ncbi:fungal-specific transcription factor domain-containing protein [Hygrophoropsis aurantiaca]|uniref:Fungal-specific transcription factor domain-containing protein n=1 Tax=Hygrophoropsis aurantiaca TaxID=72124 RepID=A0ACB8A196_9AGAM|nr:fungal-specific transcription factor domain-containing protein [Hygrophoropsis aurantiaca]